MPKLSSAPGLTDDQSLEIDLYRVMALAREVDALEERLVSRGLASFHVSGAGHDAIFVAPHAPTAMIFTPCRDGLSHNEAESMEPEQAAAGCQVLLEVVLARANRM